MTTLTDLEIFFKSIELPTSIELQKGIIIIDVSKFVKCHLSFLKANTGKRVFIPYYNRLVVVKRILSNEQSD